MQYFQSTKTLSPLKKNKNIINIGSLFTLNNWHKLELKLIEVTRQHLIAGSKPNKLHFAKKGLDFGLNLNS